MIVEDDYANMKVFEYMMKMLHLDYDMAGNGNQAIAGFDADRHKVVLIDINLPDITGYDLLNRLREMTDFDTSFCFVAQTAKVTSLERERCLEMGFCEYISKPISFSNFRVMMEKVLAKFPEGSFNTTAETPISRNRQE